MHQEPILEETKATQAEIDKLRKYIHSEERLAKSEP